MNRLFTAFPAVLALAVLPIAAPAQAQARPPARVDALYPIPPGGSGGTPVTDAHAAAGAAAGKLAKLSPAALAGKGGVELGATAPGPGTFTFVLTAKIHGETVVIGKGSAVAGAAGVLTLELKLTKAGKAALKGTKGKLEVTVAASFKPKQGSVGTARSTATLK